MEVHPLHSLIVHFPIALSGSALFFILLALWRKDDTLEKAAFANIALATVSTVVAGLTGLRDNNDIYDGAAPNSNVKIILASILLVVTLLVTISRWRKPDLFHSSIRILYISGYFLSFALVSVLGFLGGVILYGFHDNTLASNDSAATAIPTEETVAELIPVTSNEEKIEVSFSKDIQPIFESRCIKCHGGLKTEEGLDLTTYEMLMAGSENGSMLSAGDSGNSPLVQLSVEGKMPKRGPKLTPSEIQLLIDWIDTGAPNN
jgi:uncharacterized membrane protein